MTILLPLSHYLTHHEIPPESPPDYSYQGLDPSNQRLRQLPRTRLSEKVAYALLDEMRALSPHPTEGKMLGVLIVRDREQQLGVLKAFSGSFEGETLREGWVPPIPGREEIAEAEAKTIQRLNEIKYALLALEAMPERQHYREQLKSYQDAQLAIKRQQSRQREERRKRRALLQASLDEKDLALALEALDEESRQESTALRHFKRARDLALDPLKEALAKADQEILAYKQERKLLSCALQDQMYAAYRLQNFAGESQSLDSLFEQGRLPTGTGECCAPKLLHYAAVHRLHPLGMAEIWFGPPLPSQPYQEGHLYEACAERCQPIMGFLLAGLPSSPQIENDAPHPTEINPPPQPLTPQKVEIASPHASRSILLHRPSLPPLPLLYEDEVLLVIDKPHGLLSVPGRVQRRQDSVLNRMRLFYPELGSEMVIHRIDQATSGILLLARHAAAQRDLNKQFQRREIEKTYEALLSCPIAQEEGEIDLPLYGTPRERPYQRVDLVRGKAALTRYRVIEQNETQCRIAFYPVTGRTHQLRVHAADPRGLNAPILGDPLYQGRPAERMFLHAHAIRFRHPVSGEMMSFLSPVPF